MARSSSGAARSASLPLARMMYTVSDDIARTQATADRLRHVGQDPQLYRTGGCASGSTQEQLATKEGKSARWVIYKLCLPGF